jgi:hypothetical protein
MWPDSNNPLGGIYYPNTISGCVNAALTLFYEIDKLHGRAVARRIFTMWASGPSPRKLGFIKNAALLDRYDMMRPTPNVQRLAQELAEENKTLPRGRRHGPRGTTNALTMDKHIRRLLAERDRPGSYLPQAPGHSSR